MMFCKIYKTEWHFHTSTVTNFSNKISGAKNRNLYFELNVSGMKCQDIVTSIDDKAGFNTYPLALVCLITLLHEELQKTKWPLEG